MADQATPIQARLIAEHSARPYQGP